MNVIRAKAEAKGKPLAPVQGCASGDCASCGNGLCGGHVFSVGESAQEEKKE